MDRRATINVFGQVQGVFFRHDSKVKAEELGLSGFARNEIDGSVFIVVEGEEDEINKFIEWAKIGTSNSEVEDIEVKWEDYKGDFSYFRIE